MSFVIGMAAGYEARKLQEERSIRQQIRAYFERLGIRLTDRHGNLISTEEFLAQITTSFHSKRAIIELGTLILIGCAFLGAIGLAILL